VIAELLSGRTNVNVLLSQVTEVLLAEAPLGLCIRSHRFWQRDCDASFVAPQNLIAVEVATIGNGLEVIDAESVLGLASDVCELRSI
jgi:hypothetical protein